VAWFIYALGYNRGWNDHATGKRYWIGASDPPGER